MKILLAVAILLISNLSHAQENAVDRYFKDFQQKHSLDLTTVSSKMFSAFLESKDAKGKEELAAILKKLTGLKILNKYGPKNGDELYKAACALVPAAYETILVLSETDRNASFYTREDKNGKITELVMIAFQWGRFLIVSVTGDINLNDIIKLSQNLNLEALTQTPLLRLNNQ